MGPPRSPVPGAELPALALVVALAAERRAAEQVMAPCRRTRGADPPRLRGRLAGWDLILVQAGIGAARARRALLEAAGTAPLAAAWSLGFAGGLAPALRTGDLVCPERVLCDRGGSPKVFVASAARDPLVAGLARAGRTVLGGALLTVESPLRTPDAKRAAAARTGASVVDMEAAGVAEAAAELGIPWLALKVVLDPADLPLTARLARCATPAGDPRWTGILAALAAGREARQALWRLRAAARCAAARLAESLGPALAAWAHLDAAGALQ